jgi:hypothetical protein
LRALGIHALEHLAFYAETYNDRYREKIERQHTKPLEFQYPVSLAGINVAHFVVFELFKLNQPRSTRDFVFFCFTLIHYSFDWISCLILSFICKDTPDVDSVHPMLLQRNGLFNVYSIIFEKLDLDWEQKQLKYMDFNMMMSDLKKTVSDIFKNNRLMNIDQFKVLSFCFHVCLYSY